MALNGRSFESLVQSGRSEWYRVRKGAQNEEGEQDLLVGIYQQPNLQKRLFSRSVLTCLRHTLRQLYVKGNTTRFVTFSFTPSIFLKHHSSPWKSDAFTQVKRQLLSDRKLP